MIHMGILIKQLALFRIIAWRCKLILANAVFECCVCRLAAPSNTGVANSGIAIACWATGRGQTRTGYTEHTGRYGRRSGIMPSRASIFGDCVTHLAMMCLNIWHPGNRTRYKLIDPIDPWWYHIPASTYRTRTVTHHWPCAKNIYIPPQIPRKFTSIGI